MPERFERRPPALAGSSRPPRAIEVFFLAFLALGTCASCDRGRAPVRAPARWGAAHPGVAEVPAGTELRPVAGQTIYVPVYSQVLLSEKGRPFDLSVVLSVRNTDRGRPIVVEAVRYYGSDGRPVRDFLKRPLRIAPMATADFFVSERDASGGTSASFLVEWVAEQAVSDPIVEAVMVGTASNQGLSFTSSGRVVSDRAR